jgi:recombination protein RecA
MSLARSEALQHMRSRSLLGPGPETEARRPLPLSLGGLADALPDGGLPRGVVEIASPYGLARASSIALTACKVAQEEARLRGKDASAGAWCAWIERAAQPRETTLFAPAVERAGVDLGRLLVVHPTDADLAKVAVRMASSRVFAVLVIDLAGVPGHRAAVRLDRWVTIVRRMAIAIEGTSTTVVLLTDLLAPRALPLPVAMRLEIDRPGIEEIRVTIAKERRGHLAKTRVVALPASIVA